MAKNKASPSSGSPSPSAPYRVITGEFQLYYRTAKGVHSGSQPDGDTIKFKPDRGKAAFKDVEEVPVPGGAMPLEKQPRRRVDFNVVGQCSLRFEAIDSLELHFQGAQQHDALARAARQVMLKRVGFDPVTYAPKKFIEVRSAVPHPIRGYIITRAVDVYGRPVSFVFTGEAPKADNSTIFLRPTQVRKSVNAAVLRAGHAYATFYAGLPTDLRNAMASLSRASRKPAKGLWVGFSPLTLSQAGSMTALSASRVWPKLFRRLIGYFKATAGPLSGFDSWLRGRDDDDAIWIIPNTHRGNLHDVYEISGSKLAMKFETDQLIIVPR
jgi:hypothetical protein